MEKTYKDKSPEEIKKMIEERRKQLVALEHTEFNRRHRELHLKLQGNICRLEKELERLKNTSS